MGPRPRRTKEQVLAALRSKKSLPMRLGAPSPRVELVFQEGRFRVRELGVEPGELERARAEAFAARRSFTPDHVEQLLKPIGRVLFEAETFEELRAHLESREWPKDW